MAELITMPSATLAFYCWSCRYNHYYQSDDVERIVQALAVEIVHQRDSERVPPDSPADLDPPCLNEALRWAGDGYADHVADSITRREQDIG